MQKKTFINLLIALTLTFSIFNSVGCTTLSSLPTPTSTVTPTPTITFTPTKAPTKTTTPTSTPRPTITIESYSNKFPLEWEIPPLSEEQVNQVSACELEKIAEDRYPSKNKPNELIYLFDPVTACDWAVLTYAYVSRLSDDEHIPDIAKNAFANAIYENPGFAFSNPLFYYFSFESFPIVKSPPLFEQELTNVRIEYTWSGMGDPVKYKVDIRQTDTSPYVKVTEYKPASVIKNINTKVDKDLIQKLGNSLSNLLPIKNQFSLLTCWDNYPDWTVTLTYKDGTRQVVKTNGSNMVTVGGPWQTNIDGQDYLQFSVEFIAALDRLIYEIGLPYGQPAAMGCGPQPVIDQAYP